MTICIATICEEKYAVILTDRMLTVMRPSIEFEPERAKFWDISDECVMATAGDALAPTDLARRIHRQLSESGTESIPQMAEIVKACFKKERDQLIEDGVLGRVGLNWKKFYSDQQAMQPLIATGIFQQMYEFEYHLWILLAGVDDNGAHIYRIENPGILACFDAIGFNAIGSGEDHALTTFIAHDYESDVPLKEGLFFAYKAKKIAEKASGVGKQTSIKIITQGRGSRILSDAEIGKLEAIYVEDLRIHTEKSPDVTKMIEEMNLPECRSEDSKE